MSHERELHLRYGQILDELQARLREMRHAVVSGDLSTVWVWAIPDQLAVTTRPLRDDRRYPKTGLLPPEAAADIEVLVDRFEQGSFATIVAFNADDELRRYETAGLGPGGLLGYYRHRGFHVVRMPWLDPARHPEARASYPETKARLQREVLDAYPLWAKPVLMHCSGASDRSPPVAAWLASHYFTSPPTVSE